MGKMELLSGALRGNGEEASVNLGGAELRGASSRTSSEGGALAAKGGERSAKGRGSGARKAWECEEDEGEEPPRPYVGEAFVG
jgi:hypothetical protein